jgi:hypothetical protein
MTQTLYAYMNKIKKNSLEQVLPGGLGTSGRERRWEKDVAE